MGRVLKVIRVGALPLCASLALLAAAPAADATQGPSGDLVAGAEETALRLADLPLGYQVGDDSGCGPWDPEGASSKVVKFIVRYWPEGCAFQYERLFRVPGPETAPLVESESTAFPNTESAERGFALLTRAGGKDGESRPKEILPPPALGERARFFHSHDVLVEGKPRRPGSILFWRQGTLISALLVAGRTPPANDRIALRLAQLQQARVESPTPYAEAEQDDTQVALDNPALGVPVYWLGPEFAPGHGLPAGKLEEAFTLSGLGSGGPPGEKVSLWYEGLTVDAWTRASWKHLQRSPLGPLNRGQRCTTITRVPLDGGHADVFAAYGKDYRRCPRRAPDRYFAIAHLGSMVVGVNLALCTQCLRGEGAFNSLAGMKAAVRALHLRPKPTY
jgi:hypothetical protein